MWYHYKSTLIGAQLAIGLICWMIYRAAAPDPGLAATAFMVMQVGAVVGSIRLKRLRRRLTLGDSRFLN